MAVYALTKIGRRGKERSPVLKRISETISIIVWVLLAAYTVSFLYWLYTEILK